MRHKMRIPGAILAALVFTNLVQAGNASKTATKSEAGVKWDYQVFFTREPENGDRCYKPDSTVCFNQALGDRLNMLADKGWQIQRIERVKLTDNITSRYFYIYTRRPRK